MSHPNVITSNIDDLLDIIPARVRTLLSEASEPTDDLLEIVLDLGRLPEARYRTTANLLGTLEITFEDIEAVTSRISAFG